MNKAEFVNAMAEQTGLSKKDSEAAINAFVNIVSDELVKKEKVSLIGFGTFETRERAAREGRNPRTTEAIIIPASIAPVFKPGKELKEKVNK